MVHEDERQGADTLIHRVQHYLYHKGEYDPAAEASFAPALCNRIDRNTEGDCHRREKRASAAAFKPVHPDRELHKFYLCLVKGVPRPKEATIKAFMRKDEQENKVTVFDRPVPGGKTMVTRYRVLKAKGKVSLCEVELLTGRHPPDPGPYGLYRLPAGRRRQVFRQPGRAAAGGSRARRFRPTSSFLTSRKNAPSLI